MTQSQKREGEVIPIWINWSERMEELHLVAIIYSSYEITSDSGSVVVVSNSQRIEGNATLCYIAGGVAGEIAIML